MDPYALYALARSRWQAQKYPAFLTYTVTIAASERGRAVANTYISAADMQTGAVHVQATSIEESAHPYVPRGVTVRARLNLSYSRNAKLFTPPSVDGGGDINISKQMNVSAQQQYDLLGVPLLSPAYSFGLAPQAEMQPARVIEPSTVRGPKTIASVTAVPRDYDLTYAGMDTVDGAACYHLRLTPRHDPDKLRLRELWIDPDGYVPRQALIQGNFTEGPGPKMPWLISFMRTGNAVYIAQERAVGTVQYLRHTYADVTISFGQLKPAATIAPLWNLTIFGTSGDVLKEPPL